MSERNAVHLASPDTYIKCAIQTSFRPKPEIASFHLYMGPLVHPTNRYRVHPTNCFRFMACPSVRPSVRPSGNASEELHIFKMVV